MIAIETGARPAVTTNIILDTDMGNDIDDALALAMIHSLQARGECELLGVTVSKDNPYAPRYVDLLNTFYGRGDVPIGVVRGGATPEDGLFVRQIVTRCDAVGRAQFPLSNGRDGAYPEAIGLLRQLLVEAADRSVTVVMIGFSTNMARLLASGPDRHSELDGRALFARKVGRVVMMAAEFSERALGDAQFRKPEFNVRHDVAAAQAFVSMCPTPIEFSGLEIGLGVVFPAAGIEEGYAWADPHPVAEAYRLYRPMPYDRPSWDQTAVLHAVRPSERRFSLSLPGHVTIDDDGRAGFVADPHGPHRHLVMNEAQAARVRAEVVELCTQPIMPRVNGQDRHTGSRNGIKAAINGAASRAPEYGVVSVERGA